tara:strand:+ start:3027 stop:7847 length:4821 start_codon:yes stop_codon:yes gene_type:complete
MSKAIRIKTNPGSPKENYVSINLNQDFDQLKVLSLTIDQEDAYKSFESNYGVVAGRVDINNGFGLKNSKVSIFIPLDDIDKENEIVSELYPYQTISDKNSNGVRYNILPSLKQNKNHTPVGTFPSKREVLDNPTMVEIYDKYYKFTTTTNESGDYMFFGVPVGEQRVFIDIDVSDIGFLSVRPYELIEKGKPKEDFEDNYVFKSSNDLDKLPQIISNSEVVNVLPFWSDDLDGDKTVGITRYDFSVTEYELTPTAMFMGGLFSDNENDSISKNCRPRKKMGQMNELTTGAGVIEAITRTSNGNIVKSKEIPTDAIDENGNWAIELPMNLRKVVTDEFGALVPSPDGKKGIFSEGDYRFRISMGSDNGISKKRTRAKMLVPNMTNNYEFGEFSGGELIKNQKKGTPIFSINEQLSFFNETDSKETDPTIQYNYLEDFFTFRWKKVYTVRQYIPRYQPNSNEGKSQRNFIGFKKILDGNGVNKLPYNRLYTKLNPLYSILCYILLFVGFVTAFVNSFIQFMNSIISNICELKLPWICIYFDFLFGASPDAFYHRSKKTKFERSFHRYTNASCSAGKTSGSVKSENKIGKNVFKTGSWEDGSTPKYKVEGGKDAILWCTKDAWSCINAEDAGLLRGDADVNISINDTHYVKMWSNGCWTDSSNTNYFDYWKEDSVTVDKKAECIACEEEYFDPTTSKPHINKSAAVAAGDEDRTYKGLKKYFGSFLFGSIDICIRFCYYFRVETRTICPVSGLCDKCTNDDEVDPEAENAGRGPNDDGEGYGVNKGCCNGCVECDEVGVENENGNKVCPRNCLDGKCCEKIAPIGLKCAEEGLITQPTLFSTGTCGIDDKVTRCKTCSGVYWHGISNWVECTLESFASSTGMLNFEFYNDWLNGSLYFPLIKRNLKLRKLTFRGRGKGQVQKDVFCDYDCDGEDPDYQTPNGKQRVYSVKLKGGGKIDNYEFEGCDVNLPKNNFSSREWFDTISEGYNSIEFSGFRGGDISKPCSFTLLDYCTKYLDCGNNVKLRNTNKKIKIKEKKVEQVHGKPKYFKTTVEGTDGEDIEIWKNFGGHGHHKNKCKENYLVERLEYVKTDLSDCQSMNTDKKVQKATDEDEGVLAINQKNEDTGGDEIVTTFTTEETFDPNETKVVKHDLGETNVEVKFITNIGSVDITNSGNVSYRTETKNKIEVTFAGSSTTKLKIIITSNDDSCSLSCAEQGTAACDKRNGCNCDKEKLYNESTPIYRGLIREKNDEIYYASIVESTDPKFNNDYYKKNMVFPTNITELGSSVTCDIDEAPFIIPNLEQTTYQVSEEELKSKGGRGTEDKPYKLAERESIVNLSAYVDFGCNGVRCMNVRSSLVTAQVGSELYDLNDSGLECKSCSSYSDVDSDVRGYFCRRFSTFTPTSSSDSITNMKVNYVRAGGTQGENYYETYNEVSPNCRSEFNDKTAVLFNEDGDESPKFTIDNDLNDGDAITPGDKCGYLETDSLKDAKYFYAMDASSHTKNDLKHFPFSSSKLGKDGDADSTIIVEDDKGISVTSTQTPYFFYFGLIPGKTALNKLVAKYFSDVINSQTLEDVSGDENSSGESGDGESDDTDSEESINSLIGSCLKN